MSLDRRQCGKEFGIFSSNVQLIYVLIVPWQSQIFIMSVIFKWDFDKEEIKWTIARGWENVIYKNEGKRKLLLRILKKIKKRT